MCAFGVLGLSCEAPAAPKPPGSHTTAREPKRVQPQTPQVCLCVCLCVSVSVCAISTTMLPNNLSTEQPMPHPLLKQNEKFFA